MHKYWKEYGGSGSYFLIVSERQVIEVNIETGIILFSESGFEVASLVFNKLGQMPTLPRYIKVSEEDFDHYFDLTILKLIEAKSK